MASDLISRAAAIAKVEKARKAARTLTGMDFVLMLKDQPAVDAAPVVHARWIQADLDKDYVTCSYCKASDNKGRMAWTPEFAKSMIYCLTCGARMDGDANG